ncbi:hypothetical protein J6Z19_06510 [bacterium]|nr:hypothetical protein [bacterium]
MKRLFLILICSLLIFFAACGESKHHSPCDGITCSGHGTCDDSSGRAVCICDDCYVQSGTLECVLDKGNPVCADTETDDHDTCGKCGEYINGDCHAKHGKCLKNSDCGSNEQCNTDTCFCFAVSGPCKDIDCGGHGRCKEGEAYGSGYGSGSSYQSGGIYCECEEGYIEKTNNDKPTCVSINNDDDDAENDNHETQDDDNIDICGLECGFGSCVNEGGSKKCECPEGYINEDNDPTKQCIADKCKNIHCEDWQECKPSDGSCIVVYPNCNGDDDCHSGEVCDLAEHKCVEDKCDGVNCGNGGVCTVEGGNTVCNCPDGYYDNNTSCTQMTKPDSMWYGVQWPNTVYASQNDEQETIYGQIYIPDQTGSSVPQHTDWKAQLLYKEGTGNAEYPIIAGTWHKIDADFNSGYNGNNHEYMAKFPTNKAGKFIYIFRYSLDNGKSWWYGDAGDGGSHGPWPITSATNYPGKANIEAIPETLLTLDSHEKTADSYTFTLSYHGAAAIDFAKSIITLNGVATPDYEYDETTKTFTVSQANLEPNKYSWLFRLVDENGEKIEPFFVPIWIGEGVDFADFGWRDAFVYQIMTDRFLDGNPSNNVPASEFPHVTEDLEKWKGGDFAGIIKKIDDNYFSDMGVNAIWISTPVLNPHYESKGGTSSSQNNVYFTSYHAYHPLATGYSFDNDYGFDNEGVDDAFGTVAELRELVEKAHKKGIRVIPDFVVNHVYIDAPLYQQHKNDGWFYPENSCADQGWADNVIKNCWFTPYMPDFNYNNAEARKTVIEHAIWLIENFNFDGFRADALKHIDDIFVIELRKAIKEKVETTVSNHDLPDEAEVFYTVGESLGGAWPRYHVRPNMVQGQVNEQYFNAVRDHVLYGGDFSSLASSLLNLDTTFLSAGGNGGGYPGAVMGNFFGNHDQDRALTYTNGDYNKLKHAQTLLLTSPINIPMLYQGDDIGTYGKAENGFDGGRRAVMKFTGLSSNEQSALDHVKKLGKFRKLHPALRHSKRTTCYADGNVWLYKFEYNGDTVIAGINKGGGAYTGSCGISGTFTSYEGGTVNVQNGQVTIPANGSLVIGK